MTIEFEQPTAIAGDAVHHSSAAQGNAAVAEQAVGALRDALSGDNAYTRFLLKAAAGAGKSFVLKRLVGDIITHSLVDRVAVIAYTNRQLFPLAEALGKTLGKDKVCLFLAEKKIADVPEGASTAATVCSSPADIPDSAKVVISTVHKLNAYPTSKLVNAIGPGANGDTAFDVLFVDEAWQVAHYLFDQARKQARFWVGVGDVGQLPPLEVGDNPWRGDPGFNPYRAWPTDYDDDAETWSEELPAVWRPSAGHLDLWRAFYPGWASLNCVAAPGDRSIAFGALSPAAMAVWSQVGAGVPTILEVDGLPEADAPDVDLPLMEFAESLLNELVEAKVSLVSADYDAGGSPTGKTSTRKLGETSADAMIAILATRNQAVDDAQDMVDRLRKRFGLIPEDLAASTVDSWQGQTNGITIGVHPLSGAYALDEFNSAFGRLAVVCTRATHGLLLLTRPGLDDLLREAAARPGTTIGEPGFRTLPRQTHQRILASFARGKLTVNVSDVLMK